MISKRAPFLFFIILIVSIMPLPQAEALGIGPPSFELNLQMDGSNSTTFYVTSDGLEGQLIVGLEDLPFRVDPPKVNMTSSDVNVPVEITFYGNETMESGVYEGKVTFLAYTGGFVAVGIKIRAKINLLGEAQEFQEEKPTHVELTNEEKEAVKAIEEPVEIGKYEAEQEEETVGLSPYVIGGVAGGAIAVCLAIVFVWWNKR